MSSYETPAQAMVHGFADPSCVISLLDTSLLLRVMRLGIWPNRRVFLEYVPRDMNMVSWKRRYAKDLAAIDQELERVDNQTFYRADLLAGNSDDDGSCVQMYFERNFGVVTDWADVMDYVLVAAIKGHVGQLRKIKALCKLLINRPSYLGKTPLFYACSHGYTQVVCVLLDELGAIIDARTRPEFELWKDDAITPFEVAVVGGHVACCVELALRRGCAMRGCFAENHRRTLVNILEALALRMDSWGLL